MRKVINHISNQKEINKVVFKQRVGINHYRDFYNKHIFRKSNEEKEVKRKSLYWLWQNQNPLNFLRNTNKPSKKVSFIKMKVMGNLRKEINTDTS